MTRPSRYPAAAQEARLVSALAASANAVAAVPPVLRHLVLAGDPALFSDRVVARVRSLLDDLAAQLLGPARAPIAGMTLPSEGDEVRHALATSLSAHPALLSHAHALALEAALAERLCSSLGLDPVFSPLLARLTASSEPARSAPARALVAAQARFVEAQRRGQLPLEELPGDLLHLALITKRAQLGSADPVGQGRAAAAARDARAVPEASETRLALLHAVVAGLGTGADAAVDIADGGVALFLTTLALGSGQQRDAVALASGISQLPRLAVALVASGIGADAAARQVCAIHPGAAIPDGLERLAPEHAAALLACAGD